MPSRDSLGSNSRIAASLLDALHAVGDVAGHNRVRRVFDDARVNPRAQGSWLPVEVLDRAFRVLGRDRGFARRVGAGLVSNQRIGFVLFSEGVATIEKALRRSDSLLAREASDGEYAALEVGDGRARIAYRPGALPDVADGPGWNESFCGVRQGMFEALPLGFGLLPARVRETECVGKGDRQCCYEIDFGVRSLRATLIGGGTAALVGGAAVAAAIALAPTIWPWAIMAGLSVIVASAALGHCVDLAKQLDAVAGARRGHLALLEQADRALAEKMDELAKLNAQEQAGASPSAERLRAILAEREALQDGSAAADPEAGAPTQAADANTAAMQSAAGQLYEALGPMQRSVERVHRLLRENREAFDDAGEAVFDAMRGVAEESRRLASVGATLAREARGEGKQYDPVDFAAVVLRAVDSVRPLLASEQTLDVEIASPLPQVRCEPFQLEQVAYHLLRNAAEASDSDGEISLRVASVPGGIELYIEDQGHGIPEDILDQVFDPFSLENQPAGERGLGLAICYRIVTEHGGELRVSTDAGEGTRMTVALPCDDREAG